jgi:hypothetical protein
MKKHRICLYGKTYVVETNETTSQEFLDWLEALKEMLEICRRYYINNRNGISWHEISTEPCFDIVKDYCFKRGDGLVGVNTNKVLEYIQQNTNEVVEATGDARLEQDLAAQQEQIIKLNREFKEFKDEVKKELAELKSMLAQYLIQSVDEKDEAIDRLLEQI